MHFTHLFSPLTIRSVEIRHRIVSTGHQVNMLTDGLPNARLAAYHEARAAGGAGLIVIEAARMHDSGSQLPWCSTAFWGFTSNPESSGSRFSG